MRKIKALFNKVTVKLGMKKRTEPMTREEQWAARGVTFGKNFDGPDSSIDFCYGHLVTIGDNVTISGTTILAHDGSTKKPLGYCKVAPVKIGNDVFIGYGSIVLPGVTIGNKVIIGAGTVVSKDIPDNVVVVRGMDSAYKVICTYDEYMEKQKKLMDTLPISNINCLKRTEKEWKQWKNILMHAGKGYDL